MEPGFAFLFPAFVALVFLTGAISGRLGGVGRGGRGRNGGYAIPGWARFVCLVGEAAFGILSVVLLLKHFGYRL